MPYCQAVVVADCGQLGIDGAKLVGPLTEAVSHVGDQILNCFFNVVAQVGAFAALSSELEP